MTIYFVDTGYIIALEASDDQHHKKAKNHWVNIIEQGPMLITTNYVFDELTTFFNSRGYHAKAVEIGERLLQSPGIKCLPVDKAIFEKSWSSFKKYSDKTFSFTDCISFEVMRNRNINQVLSFDHHFEQAGFEILP